MKKFLLVVWVLCLIFQARISAQEYNIETFGTLKDGIAPQTLEELWKDVDTRKEPLDVEIIKEWEEDGVIMKILRYRIGIFKGQKAMMAAVYGYPKGGKNLPGLVQIHGGGQYADYRAVLTNGKRGYATISIAWAGRINAPDYVINPEIVKLFWDNNSDDPEYKLTTDWGPLDAYHAPCRNPKNNFASVAPASWTYDSSESPRNNSWFLCALGARRAITFLEQQAEVDPYKLGVYGHSMGGKLTVLTAIDPRIKAAAPSCGGISNNDDENPLYLNTIADNAYLKVISCPIIFLSPSNDFHGHLRDLPTATRLIKSKEWRVVSAPHHNHQDLGDSEVTGLLWFDQYLKGTFTYPKTPVSQLILKTKNGIPTFTVSPDASKSILAVDIYYTQQGENFGEVSERDNRINRFWHYAGGMKSGNTWTADLPLLTTDKPLWVYANIIYSLDEPVTGAGYYYNIYTTEIFNISTLIQVASPEQLKAAKVKNTMEPSLVIESFDDNWEKEWFTYKEDSWERTTHKLYNDKWKAPANAKLAIEVRSEEANKIIVGIDGYAAEIQLKGGSEWQSIVLKAKDFRDGNGGILNDWSGIVELKLGEQVTLKGKDNSLKLGAEWKGKKPEFRNLQWLKK